MLFLFFFFLMTTNKGEICNYFLIPKDQNGERVKNIKHSLAQ